ncbi:MAG TPA: YggS family pyridoxal phosphate-dependent enzyme [Candidatus Paceibacterota bacterium]|nr:YggS family pyridoxal phosphate-dependent enzyme [Verrucomicrobiota bacterium]HRY48344.1 YggS family pyridoxal phosphate-dependent enzyme [Candidatus Paceibacterota bacterium]HSA01987.1 YggS family pyridoxal phosphate-dependent enzyme [Candidatus Paceibacterota bacterium]
MDFSENLAAIHRRISTACERARRLPASVILLAVSKSQRPEEVRDMAAAGQVLFGENRVQEARAKIAQCPSRLHWHMIGHLQSNKCRDAVQLFEMIQSVDSLDLASEINRRADLAAKTMPVLLEVNVAGESSKFGYPPDKVLAEIGRINQLPRIEIHGLMTVAPYATDPEKVRPVFRRLRELKLRCEDLLGAPLPHLSMGMSGDFEVAIEEGATLVRIGSALFGPRQRPVGESDGP